MSFKGKLQEIKVINNLYTVWKWRERRVSYGEMHPDKTFFVIRRAYCKVGLFSYVMTNMGLVDYAVKKGYIPIIDMQNCRNTYLDDQKLGKENAWEYFFRQPCGYTLQDIGNAKNVILSSGLITEKNSYPDFRIAQDQRMLAYWRRVFQTYFKMNDETERLFWERRSKLPGEGKILGILARGTDYVSAKPKGHPVQPDAGQIIAKAGEVLKEYACQRIYLATEDAEIYEKLKAAFGPLLLAPDMQRYQTARQENINDVMAQDDMRILGREYLLSMMILSSCDCLVAGNVGGTHGALLMGSGYEYRYIFNLGVYE